MTTEPEADEKPSVGLVAAALAVAAGGWWLRFELGDSPNFLLNVLGGLGAAVGSVAGFVAVREVRLFFEPEAVAAEEERRAEREAAARERGPRLAGVLFMWALCLPFVGFLIWYATDDSGAHGERTVWLTLAFVGFVVLAVVGAVLATVSWLRSRR